MSALDALVAENKRLADALERERTATSMASELSREKVAHLERTVNELTRQSTNDAFQAARKCVARRRRRRRRRRGAPGAAIRGRCGLCVRKGTPPGRGGAGCAPRAAVPPRGLAFRARRLRRASLLLRARTHARARAARRLAEREKELDALRAASSAPSPVPSQSTGAAVADATARLEAKWAGLLDSLQSEWALERARLETGLERERLAAAEAASKAAGERARLVKLAESRIGELTHKVSKDVVATGRQCARRARTRALARTARTPRRGAPPFRSPFPPACARARARIPSRAHPPSRARPRAQHAALPLSHARVCHVTRARQAARGAASEGRS
jgi:hypothetical protein